MLGLAHARALVNGAGMTASGACVNVAVDLPGGADFVSHLVYFTVNGAHGFPYRVCLRS